MSLHIRVSVSFWTHRKTLRLRAAIGEAAYWVPIKLWSYAAQNQPDGNFADYSDEEIAMLVGYAGDAKALLNGLLGACFMDADRKIHHWHDHNSYHASFHERAVHAAKARWAGKKRKESTGNERKGKETSIASGMLVASTSDDDWLLSLKEQEAYKDIEVRVEYSKMVNWCKVKNVKPTRLRFIRWLNNVEKPLRPHLAEGRDMMRKLQPAPTGDAYKPIPPKREVSDEELAKQRKIVREASEKLKEQMRVK